MQFVLWCVKVAASFRPDGKFVTLLFISISKIVAVINAKAFLKLNLCFRGFYLLVQPILVLLKSYAKNYFL